MLVTDGTLYYRRKPAGLPSTFGEQECFLDALYRGDASIFDIIPDLPDIVGNQVAKFDLTKVSWQEFREHLLTTFDKEDEYGLLNRLDNDTSGRLYFANSHEIKNNYIDLQSEGTLQKHYVAQVAGDCSWLFKKSYNYVEMQDDEFVITIPIMHHVEIDERMVGVVEPAHLSKGRGELLDATSRCAILSADGDTTWLRIAISKGVRHQIRVHLSALGYPIIGDVLYGIGDGKILHLWSVGCQI